jgi:hypothetical protein
MTKRLREEDLLERVRDLCDDPAQITVDIAVDEIREHGFKVRRGTPTCILWQRCAGVAWCQMCFLTLRSATHCCITIKGTWWRQGDAVSGCVHVAVHVDLEGERRRGGRVQYTRFCPRTNVERVFGTFLRSKTLAWPPVTTRHMCELSTCVCFGINAALLFCLADDPRFALPARQTR